MDISSKNISETHGIDSENDQFLKRSHPMVAQKVQKNPPAADLPHPRLARTHFLIFSNNYIEFCGSQEKWTFFSCSFHVEFHVEFRVEFSCRFEKVK